MSPPPRSRKRYEGGKGNTMAAVAREEYKSSLVERSLARQRERAAFLKDFRPAMSPSVSALVGRDGRKEDERRDGKGRSKKDEARIATTPRTRRLWDFDSPDSRSEGGSREGRDEDDSLFDVRYDQTATYERASYARADASGDKIWDTAQIRRELRRDVTKQAKSELGELERFARDMRKRIERYNPVMEKDDGTKVVVDTEEGSEEGADKAGGVGGGYRSTTSHRWRSWEWS